jgi:large subunit ribosomal protein L11
MQIKLLVEGGDMKPGPALSQKLGPAGVPMNEVIQKVNESTKNFGGLKVPVEVEIDTKTKNIGVKVFSPPVSELLKKELGAEKGSGDHKQMQVANASIEQIISIAKIKLPGLLSRDLKAAVKTVLGSCTSLGILVENKSPKEVISEIDEGKYEKDIQEERIETSEEKRAKLDKFFEIRKTKQEKDMKALEEAKAAEEAAKAEAPAEGEEKPEEAEESEEPEKE